jgi:prepilin-type N-terminal cleavage/methylation domain-containing protein
MAKIFKMRKGFTLIEILISVSLLSLVLMGLYESLDIQRASNKHLFEYLQKSVKRDRAIMVLFNDLLKSDGNITLKKSDFDRLCINSTVNSLYGLPSAKVCWAVLKQKNTLVRVEGNDYNLPLNSEDRVEIDKVIENLDLFDITYNKKKAKILVVAQVRGSKPYTFLLRGLSPPIKKKKKKKGFKKPSQGQGGESKNGGSGRTQGGGAGRVDDGQTQTENIEK